MDQRPAGQHDHIVAPAERRDDSGKRPLPDHAAGEADREGDAAEESETPGRQPEGGNDHAADEGEGRAETDQGPAGVGHLDRGRETHDGAAEPGRQDRDGQHPARPPPVGEQAAGDLQGGVGPEVDRRQVADDGAADREIAHQRLDRDRRRNPQDPGVEEETRRHEPAGIGEHR